MALCDSITRVSKSVAWLEVERPGGDVGSGTAFVVESRGRLATAAHLLQDARAIRVTLIGTGGVAASAEVERTDASTDVALIRIDARDLTPVSLRRGAPAPLGREVALMGFPHADIFQPPLVMTMRGIVGNLYRLGAADYYVVDASAAEGMSGGPLFLAESGEVIGLLGGRFDPGKTKARMRGLAPDVVRALPSERTSISFVTSIAPVLALLAGRRE